MNSNSFIKYSVLILMITIFLSGVLFLFRLNANHLLNFYTFSTAFLIVMTILLSIQGVFTLLWMLYFWEDPEKTRERRSPEEFVSPKFSFTAIVPARNEESVIQDTIRAINNIKYPGALKEIIVICRQDDVATIAKAQAVIAEINSPSVKLMTFNNNPISKPHVLNVGLFYARNDFVAVFDAEDEPHPDIFNIVNTVLVTKGADVVQSGVQLMNHRSNWFSALNVLEYFFWFKSGLHFFNNFGGVTPLGGNTVFMRRALLNKLGGWDEECLTEDAEIGMRLSLYGAKIEIIYDEQHVTREECPNNLGNFIRQRTRWNQGFMQIMFKGDWLKLPKLRQRMVALYILSAPEIQALFLMLIPISFLIALTQKVPIGVALLSFVPFAIFMVQLLVNVIGMFEFSKAYGFRVSPLLVLKILITFYPFQLLLMISSFRAVGRYLLSNNTWEKTLHINAHRDLGVRVVYADFVENS